MELQNIKEYNADYHKDGTLVWKKIGEKTGKSGKGIRKKKNYQSVNIKDVQVNGEYPIDESILQQAKELYFQTKELIPVYLSFDYTLISGYEQYELARELGLKNIPAIRNTQLNKKEQRAFRRSVTNRSLGNKKYSITAIDGSKIFLSLNQYKQVQRAFKYARKANSNLEILPSFTFCLVKDDEYIIGNPTHGIHLKTLCETIDKTIAEI